MKLATLNTEWHGVPAGTRLILHTTYRDVQENEIAVVSRTDGEELPGPWGPGYRTNVAIEFIDIKQ
jgi:hypothetical protein